MFRSGLVGGLAISAMRCGNICVLRILELRVNLEAVRRLGWGGGSGAYWRLHGTGVINLLST